MQSSVGKSNLEVAKYVDPTLSGLTSAGGSGVRAVKVTARGRRRPRRRRGGGGGGESGGDRGR
jgi:hypothetical protein